MPRVPRGLLRLSVCRRRQHGNGLVVGAWHVTVDVLQTRASSKHLPSRSQRAHSGEKAFCGHVERCQLSSTYYEIVFSNLSEK